ncbi:hypothetical protein C8J57DRAFT_1211561 [Mycena rebaudengoi]|nr:hypothetical protein C8J57DRAFT_1211561 [Mycena rebaudengoi]
MLSSIRSTPPSSHRLAPKTLPPKSKARLTLSFSLKNVLASLLQSRRTAPGPSKLSLSRTLPRPVLREVDLCNLVNVYPDLADIPAEYIHDHLPATATRQAAVHAVETSIPKGALPKELEILMNDIVAAACPTHMFAVYSNTPLAINQKRRVSLFPIHDIVSASTAPTSPHSPHPILPPSPCTKPSLSSSLRPRPSRCSIPTSTHGSPRRSSLCSMALESTVAAMQAASSS